MPTSALVDTTFGGFLLGHYNSPWFLIFLSVVSALAGMFTHWAKINMKDKEDIRFMEYFFVTNKYATIKSVIGVLGGLFVAFAPIDYTTITAYQAIIQAFSLGYASDSIFNRATDDGRSV